MKKRDPFEKVRWVVETDRQTMNAYRRQARKDGIAVARLGGLMLDSCPPGIEIFREAES